MPSFSVSVMIPNINGKHLLQKNLPLVINALAAYPHKKELIISDDNSADGSMDYLDSIKSDIEKQHITCFFVKDKYPSGFANNVTNGVSYATGDILVLLNSDVAPEKNFLQPLLDHFSDEKVFAVGCLEQTTDDDGKPKQYGRSMGYFARGFVMHKALNAKAGSSTFWISCGSGAFRKSFWDRLSGLDRLYNPFYWEDIDLSYRAVKAGYKIIFEPKSIIHHFHEKGAIKSTFSPAEVRKIVYRNQFSFFWKNITDKNLLLRHWLWLPYHILHAFLHGDMIFLAGFWRALVRLPEITHSRANAKKLFTVSDEQVLQQTS